MQEIPTPPEQDNMLRLWIVKKRTGLARSTIYKKMSEKTFPKQIPLGGRSVGWLESEVQSWVQECKQNRDQRN